MKNKLAILFLILLAGTLYTLTLRGVAGNPEASTIKATLEEAPKPFELSPERGRFAHIISLVENHSYALSTELGNFVYPDVGWYNGKFYSYFAPGMSYMAAPFYVIGKHFNLSQVFTFGFVSLVSILALIFLFKICREIFKMPIWASVLAVLVFAFGSTAWSYAITLYQHHLTVFFILSSFYAVWRYKQKGRLSWMWASWVWIAYALAISIDYPNALFLLPVMVYFLLVSLRIYKEGNRIKFQMREAILITMIFFVALISLQFYHNQKEFGSWKRLSSGLVGYKVIVENHWDNLSVSEINQKLTGSAGEKNVVKFFSEEHVPNSFGTLWFSKDRGILFYSPIFLLGLLGIFWAFRKLDLEKSILIAIIVANVFLYSSWGDPWGGWAFGPRYLIPSMSVLSIFVVSWLISGRFVWLRRVAAFLLFAYSSAVALIGALTTNAVPPRIEADYFHTTYNYLRNIDYLKSGNSGSFLFNTYFSGHVSLMHYAIILYCIVMVVFAFFLFALPLFDKSHD